METVYLWWIGADAADDRAMEAVRAHVERVFGVSVRVWRGTERPGDAFDARRGQHSSTRILRWLLGVRPPDATKVVAVTDADLFIPVLTFVFGEAQLGGAAAVVSTARLGPSSTSGRDNQVLSARLAKECVHELGHTFGLIHCANRGCVMARAVSALDVDAKSNALCPDCRSRYREFRRSLDDEHDQRTDAYPRRG